MSDNTLVFFAVIVRGLCVLAAITGAVYLAYQDRDGWGWMIFLAVILGCYDVKTP